MDRRAFLNTAIGATALAAGTAIRPARADVSRDPLLAEAIARLPKDYLTPQLDFRSVERGNPLPYKLPEEKRREVGLERETWQLEVLADGEETATSGVAAKVANPLSKTAGNAFKFADLVKLAETKAVRFVKVVSCNNILQPLGLGVWEGVPLRDVIWLAKPQENYRSIYYDGYHNDKPEQLFQCWLPANRVLEDPPGFLPVILCYKINGEWLTGKRGGPVRLIVPEAYGFKSVKWLNRVVITNKYQAEDTYAKQNNEVNDSWLKTHAVFGEVPKKVSPQTAFAISGQAQVGVGGLAKIQWWAQRQDQPWPADDEYFARAPWQDAEILPLADDWRGTAEIGPLHPLQFDPQTNRPRAWPLRHTCCNWVALLQGLPSGKYDLRCRTIDENGHAQPLPRPWRKSGQARIQKVEFEVT